MKNLLLMAFCIFGCSLDVAGAEVAAEGTSEIIKTTLHDYPYVIVDGVGYAYTTDKNGMPLTCTLWNVENPELESLIIPETINMDGVDVPVVAIGLESPSNSVRSWNYSYLQPNLRNVVRIFIPKTVTYISNSYKWISSYGEVNYVNFPFLGIAHRLETIEVDCQNEYYYSLDGILFSKNDDLLRFPSQKIITFYTIPDEVISIASYAFEDANIDELNLNGVANYTSTSLSGLNLKTIDMDKVENVGNLNLPATLQSVKIGSRLKSLKSTNPFSHVCLNDIEISQDNPNYELIDGILCDEENIITSLSIPRQQNYTLPSKTKILSGAINTNNFGSVESLTIPSSIMYVGGNGLSITVESLKFEAKANSTWGSFLENDFWGRSVEYTTPMKVHADSLLIDGSIDKLPHGAFSGVNAKFIRIPKSISSYNNLSYVGYPTDPDERELSTFGYSQYGKNYHTLYSDSSVPLKPLFGTNAHFNKVVLGKEIGEVPIDYFRDIKGVDSLFILNPATKFAFGSEAVPELKFMVTCAKLGDISKCIPVDAEFWTLPGLEPVNWGGTVNYILDMEVQQRDYTSVKLLIKSNLDDAALIPGITLTESGVTYFPDENNVYNIGNLVPEHKYPATYKVNIQGQIIEIPITLQSVTPSLPTLTLNYYSAWSAKMTISAQENPGLTPNLYVLGRMGELEDFLNLYGTTYAATPVEDGGQLTFKIHPNTSYDFYPAVCFEEIPGYVCVGNCVEFLSRQATAPQANIETTQCTMTVTVRATNYDEVDEMEVGVNVNGTYYVADSDRKVKLENLLPGTKHSIVPTVYYDGYRLESTSSYSAMTKRVVCDIELIETTPVSMKIRPLVDNGDCPIDFTQLIYNESEVDYEDNFMMTHLDPDTSYGFTFKAYYTGNGEQFFVSSNKSFRTSQIEILTQPARITSTTSANLIARTNFDVDGSTGFEWRRTDAPEVVPSIEVGCPVIDNQIVGTLRNINPDVYYKYRPYYISSSEKKYYGEWIGFYSADANIYFEPEVITRQPSAVYNNSAVICGSVIEGSDAVEEQGIEIWPVQALSRSHEGIEKYVVQDAKMQIYVENLQAGTTYVYRAFAKTSKSVYYGDEVSFVTPGDSDVEMIIIDDTAAREVECYFNIQGVRMARPVKGFNIVKYTDGSTSKLMVR